MKKKFLIALASAFAFLSLVGCDNSNNNATDETKTDTTTETDTKKDSEQTTPTAVALTAPTITLSEKTVSWQAVSNATGYVVNVNGTDKAEQTATTFTLTETTAGDYTVKVKAVSSNSAYTASAYSSTVTITVEEAKKYDAKPEIFLAGDSTVKTYKTDQFIGGWGQYLGLYLPDDIVVHNAAQGGRSSRSFINEGRLYDTKETGYSYTFTENDGKSIESQIEAGDFLFIQFGHNDDDTKSYTDLTYQYERFVTLGTPDANGIYPTVEPSKTSTATLPSDMPSGTQTNVKKYGANYYAYDATGAKGTYKGFLKEYIDFARENDAIPVLVTPVSRVKFNAAGEIIGGAGLHGENFAYVQAVRQLAEEEDCLLVDLFAYSKTMLETATPTYANYTMALKPNSLTGTWPTTYDQTYNNTDLGYEGIEATHYNKYGAYLEAAYVAQTIKASTETHQEGTEYFTFKDNVKTTPSSYINPSNLISKTTVAAIEATITGVTVTDPNRTYPTTAALEAKLAEIPAVDAITNDNYIAVGELAEDAEVLYAALNVDDRKAEYKEKIDATKAKVQELVIANRPVATNTYSMDCTTFEAVSDVPSPFIVDDTSAKFSISGKCLKFGTSGNTSKDYLKITISGTGKVVFSAKAYSGNTSKACLLAVSNGTDDQKENITVGAATLFEYEFDIDGEVTFYMYRASGSGTGVMLQSLTVEYFAA